MKTTNEHLDQIKQRLQLNSDGELARWLGCKRQYVSGYRHLLRPLDELHAFAIEEALHLPRGEVLAANRIERAKTEQERQAWKNFMKRLRTAAATVALTAVGSWSAGPAPAEAVTLKVTSHENSLEKQSVTKQGASRYTLCAPSRPHIQSANRICAAYLDHRASACRLRGLAR